MSLTPYTQQVHKARARLHRHFETYMQTLNTMQPMDYQAYIRSMHEHAHVFLVIDELCQAKEVYDLLHMYGSYPADTNFVSKVDTLMGQAKQKKLLQAQWDQAVPLYEQELDRLQTYISSLHELTSSKHATYKDIAQTYTQIRQHVDRLTTTINRYETSAFFSSLCMIARTAKEETMHVLERELMQLPKNVDAAIIRRCYTACIENFVS